MVPWFKIVLELIFYTFERKLPNSDVGEFNRWQKGSTTFSHSHNNNFIVSQTEVYILLYTRYETDLITTYKASTVLHLFFFLHLYCAHRLFHIHIFGGDTFMTRAKRAIFFNVPLIGREKKYVCLFRGGGMHFYP